MNFTALLDTAIGLSLVYLGASLFVTIMNESIARTLRLRGRDLAKHLNQLLDDSGIRSAVTSSTWIARQVESNKDLGPLIAWIQGYARAPLVQKIESYVDPKIVAQVILGKLIPPPVPNSAVPAPAPSMQDVRTAILALQGSSTVKNLLWQAAAAAKDDVNRFTAHVSDWLDKSLNMLGEGYKKRAQIISFLLGLLMAVASNIDTVQLTRRLYADKELRDSVAASAEQLTRSVNQPLFDKCAALKDQLKSDPSCAPLVPLIDGITQRNQSLAKLPIGWLDAKDIFAPGKTQVMDVVLRLAGWLLTALALSLGAPFWFDLLNRFVNIRGDSRKDDDGGGGKS